MSSPPIRCRLKQLLVRISGAGSVRFDKLKADKARVQTSPARQPPQVAGSAETLQVRISGRGA